ncbi:MAG: hypothetical protein IJU37_03790 [Desulfovibrio sp.]|nr:hypothetical protein [Desulfovibrio sp.]
MNRPHTVLPGLVLLSLLAAFFCFWTASGNESGLCVTAGCSLFQDTSIFGISLWWFGVCAFGVLAFLALLGATGWGTLLAGVFLLADTALLLLMAITSPCTNCLLAALCFALLYVGFRRAHVQRSQSMHPEAPRRSLLLLIWGLFFVLNLGEALRTAPGLWAISDNAQEATVHMFFSPSCPSCREGIALLSGHVDVAFYPVAERDQDLAMIAEMQQLLAQGESMATAVNKAQSAQELGGLAAFAPKALFLRLRLLRNKAHVFLAGSSAIPFFEFHGLPAMLTRTSRNTRPPRATPDSAYRPSPDLPLDPQIAGQCSGTAPCP